MFDQIQAKCMRFRPSGDIIHYVDFVLNPGFSLIPLNSAHNL